MIPSSMRDDKSYHVSDSERLDMLRLFVEDVADDRLILDDYFLKNWKEEMVTRDVDTYAREKYGEDISHIFGTDTIASMPSWDTEQYAAKKIKKLFIPRWNNDVSPADIENYEIFSDFPIKDISSTELREIIPEYTSLHAWYEHHPKFCVPGLCRKVSQYILDNRLYRPKNTEKQKVLLHVCCGPDVTMPILKLRDEYDIICFWYDPNIEPKREYDKRYEAFKKVCDIENIPVIKWAYDVRNFHERIRGLELTPEKGDKCTNCYDMRLYVTAKLAKRLRIRVFTSSLNTSPKKDLEKLFSIWHTYAERFDLEFLDIPFRKRGGFEHAAEYTKKHNIFRQNYCGCALSIREGGSRG